MRDRVAVVCVHVLRTRHLTHGDWCEPCALPSTITVELLLYIGHQHTRYATLTVCTDCGQVER